MTRFLTIVFIVVCVVYGWKHLGGASTGNTADSASTEELSTLAAQVEPGDVVMYSTTECQYCAQAKAWLTQYGFAFTECNMSIDADCERQFKSYRAEGTPFLIVRGNQMRNGFDSDEFIALLKN